MAGLVPATHEHRKRWSTAALLTCWFGAQRQSGATERMGGRDKPGHDVHFFLVLR